jgi:hypothetical protein
MADNWIKWCKGFALKTEVTETAALLGLNPYHIAGALMTLYEWCDSNISDANNDGSGCAFVALQSLQKFTIDWVTRTPGLADAMQKVGWLRVEADGWVFPNFYRHNGKSSKERALSSERMSGVRNKLRSERNKIATVAQPEKRREEKNIKSLSTETCAPAPESPQIDIPKEDGPPQAARPRDLIWDAMIATFGYGSEITTAQRGQLNKAVKDLKIQGATPAEIPIRFDRMRRAWDGHLVSPAKFAQWWPQFAVDPEDNKPVPKKPRGKFQIEYMDDDADFARWYRTCKQEARDKTDKQDAVVKTTMTTEDITVIERRYADALAAYDLKTGSKSELQRQAKGVF